MVKHSWHTDISGAIDSLTFSFDIGDFGVACLQACDMYQWYTKCTVFSTPFTVYQQDTKIHGI